MTTDATHHSFASFHPDDVVPSATAAALLNLSGKTLANWRSRGVGPLHVKMGTRVTYVVRDLLAFIEAGRKQCA